MFEVHRALGKMPMADIVQPAIALAKKGVAVTPFQAKLLRVVAPIYVASQSARDLFETGLNGETGPLREGEVYHPVDFADFLDSLAREGERFFYEGEVASAIVEMARKGGSIGRDDLKRYQAKGRKPIAASFLGNDVHLNPPPAIGGALIALALRLLEEQDFAEQGHGAPNHLTSMARVMRACNEARRQSGIDTDSFAGAERLQDKEFFDGLLAACAGHPKAERGTTHISVADGAGNLAAMTLSNGEGCGHIVPGCGFMLNNMLGEEDVNPGGFFQWPTATRMSSMMTPGLMHDANDAWTIFGSGGSNRIRSAILQVLVNLAAFNLPLEQAVSKPRMHVEKGLLNIEPGYEEEAVAFAGRVVERTHVWPETNMFFGGVHTVRVQSDFKGAEGAGDPRRGGVYLPA